MANPKFVPSADQRSVVQLLAGFGTKQEDIVHIIKNPRTQRPISLSTLKEVFREELRGASVQFRAELFYELRKKIRNGHFASLALALRYLGGFNEVALGAANTNSLVVQTPGIDFQLNFSPGIPAGDHRLAADGPQPSGPRLIKHQPLPLSAEPLQPWPPTPERGAVRTEPAPAPRSNAAPANDPANPQYLDTPPNRRSVFDPPRRGPRGTNWLL
jgi:hypothetical protein